MPDPLRSRDRTTRIRWTCLGAIAMSLAGAVVNLKQEDDYQRSTRDPYQVNAQPDRLAGIAAAVPGGATLGYLTDLAPGSDPYKAAFQTARYALAPRLLVPGTRSPFVLGNFSRPADYIAVGRSHGLDVVQDFGNGAVLFRSSR